MLYNIFAYFECLIENFKFIEAQDNCNTRAIICKQRNFNMASKSLMWADEEIEKLIDLYEVNPCLWDIFD